MNKIHLFFTKSLFLFFVSVILVSCGEGSIEVPYVPVAKVSSYEKDSVRTLMGYGEKGLSTYDVYINDAKVSSSAVSYSAGKIYCMIDGIAYDINLHNTRGGIRVETVHAATPEGARLFNVEYWYDAEGRLEMARVDGVATIPIYCHYKYENNTITVDDFGTDYILNLSSEKNIGYVCNVLDFSNAPITSTYVINPNLYFLNIYGVPVENLPAGQTVELSGNNLSRVGNYYYKY